MNFRTIFPLIGTQRLNQDNAPDTVARHVTGITVAGSDDFWGGAEFMYVRFAGTVADRGLVVLDAVFDNPTSSWITQATACPNTANLNKPLGVALSAATVGTFGWVQITGNTPVNSTANVAADAALGITAVGQVGAVTAGKQVLSARCVAPSTTTVVKVAQMGDTGSNVVKVNNINGWFIGAYISGTGIGAGAKITGLNVDERTITLSVNNTAAVTGNLTATYNNGATFFNVAYLGRPVAQGQIT